MPEPQKVRAEALKVRIEDSVIKDGNGMRWIRKRVLFYGDVQGVGFRYFARMHAERYNVTGFVENLYDGSVLLEVEGRDYVVDAFLEDISKGNWHINIERMEAKEIPLREDKSFRVIY